LAKLSVEAEKLVAGAVPDPVRATACGLPAALSVKFNAALRFPTVGGVKVTLTEQVPLGTTVAPVQESMVLPKSVGFAPASTTVEMERSPVPVLVTVSVWVALVVVAG
jgi:hypothetical protein